MVASLREGTRSVDHVTLARVCRPIEVAELTSQPLVTKRWVVRLVDAELHARLAGFAVVWPFGLCVAAAVMAILRVPGLTFTRFWAILVFGEVVALTLYLVTILRRRTAQVEGDSLVILDDAGIVRYRLSRAEIDGVLVITRNNHTWLEIQSRRGTPPLLGFETPREAFALLKAFRWSTTRPGQRLRLHSPAGELITSGLGGGFGLFLGGIIGLYTSARRANPLWLIVCVVVGLVGGVLVARRKLSRVHVGADGIWRSQLGAGAGEFVGYREIETFELRTYGKTTTLLLCERSGHTSALMRSGDRARVVAIKETLKAMVEAFSRQPGAADQDLLLPTHGRSFEDWMRKLRGLANGEIAAYRTHRISDEAALLVARSASAPILARLGAAFVLSHRGGNAAQPLGDVADELADPALRRAIQTLSKGPSDGEAMNQFFLSEADS